MSVITPLRPRPTDTSRALHPSNGPVTDARSPEPVRPTLVVVPVVVDEKKAASQAHRRIEIPVQDRAWFGTGIAMMVTATVGAVAALAAGVAPTMFAGTGLVGSSGQAQALLLGVGLLLGLLTVVTEDASHTGAAAVAAGGLAASFGTVHVLAGATIATSGLLSVVAACLSVAAALGLAVTGLAAVAADGLGQQGR